MAHIIRVFVLKISRLSYVGECHLFGTAKFQNCCKVPKRTAALWRNVPIDNVGSLMRKMDEHVRRSGRIYKPNVEYILKKIEETESLSASESLTLIRVCGSCLVEETFKNRMELLWKVLRTIEFQGIQVDVSHYNVLLKVFLENEYDFEPNEVLIEIKKKGLQPNRVTFQLLIAKYCKSGDINGATNLLQEMQERHIPLAISVFNSLIVAHSRNNDLDTAEKVLQIIEQAGLEKDSETYSTLICEYIIHGNLDKADLLMNNLELSNLRLSLKDAFKIIETYGVRGYMKEVDQILNKIRLYTQYHQEGTNFLLRMVTADESELAFKVMKTIPRSKRIDGTLLPLGGFFIAHAVKSNIRDDLVVKYCLQLMQENLNPFALTTAMEKSLRLGKKQAAMVFFEAAIDNHTPVKCHYFWPLLVQYGKENNIQSMLNLLSDMNNKFQIPVNTETLREIVIPLILKENLSLENIIFKLKACGASVSAVVSSIVLNLLKKNEIKKAAEIAENYSTYYSIYFIRKPLIDSFMVTKDTDSLTRLLKEIAGGIWWFSESTENESQEHESVKTYDFRDYTGQLVILALRSLVHEGGNERVIDELFNGLKKHGVGIASGCVAQVQNILQHSLSSTVTDILQDITSDKYAKPPPKAKGSRLVMSAMDTQTLERLYETLKVQHENTLAVQKHLFISYARNKDLQKLSKLLPEMESENFIFSSGMYITLLNMYVELGLVEKALKLYETLLAKEENLSLDSIKLLKLLLALVQKNEESRALEILKNVDNGNSKHWCDDDKAPYAKAVFCRKILDHLAERGDNQYLNAFLNIFLAKKYVGISSILLGPCIKVFLKRNDVDSAVNELEKLSLRYKLTPMKNELLRICVVKEDFVNLQRIIDLGSQVHGKTNSYHDLIFIFLDCGRVNDAKKMCQDVNLKLKRERFLNAAYKYYNEGDIDNMKNLLEITKKLDAVDRVKISHFLLRLYGKTNDVYNALAVWTQLQEDELTASSEFLFTLAKILRRNNHPVTFQIPEGVVDVEPKSDEYGKTRASGVKNNLRKALEDGNLDAALEMKRNNGDEHFNRHEWSSLIEACLQQGRYLDAKNLFNEYYSKYKELPLFKVSKFLFGVAMKSGDIEIFHQYENFLSSDLKKRLAFDNNICRTYLQLNRIDEYLSVLEAQFDKVKTDEEYDLYMNNFPRGGIVSVILNESQHAERCENLLRRCLEKSDGNLVPANMLWTCYMLKKNYEQADRLWDKYLRNYRGHLSFRKLIVELQKSADLDLGMKVIQKAESKTDIHRRLLGTIYGIVMTTLVSNKMIEDAMKLLERALIRINIDEIKRSDLIALKVACNGINIKFPYTIPAYSTITDIDDDYED